MKKFATKFISQLTLTLSLASLVSFSFGCTKLEINTNLRSLGYKILGVLDTSYGGTGFIGFTNPLDATKASYGEKQIELPNGTIYHVGIAYNSSNVRRPVLLKLKSNGSPDTTFATAGAFVLPVPFSTSSEDAVIYYAVLVKNRYILLAGWAQHLGEYRVLVGIFDTVTELMLPSFGTGGMAAYDMGDATRPNDLAEGVDYDADLDRLVIASESADAGWTAVVSSIFVLKFDGTYDPTFNSGAPYFLSTPAITDPFNINGIKVTQNAYLVWGAEFDSAYTYNKNFLAEVSKAGSAVISFGTNGFVLSPNNVDIVNAVSIVGNSALVGYGTFNYDQISIGRVDLATGAKDLSFGSAGLINISSLIPAANTGSNTVITDLSVQSDGSILALWADATDGYVTSFNPATASINQSFATNGSIKLPRLTGGTKNYTWGFNWSSIGIYIFGACFDSTNLVHMCTWKLK